MSAVFKYRAKDSNRMRRDGEIEAISQDEAVKKLQSQGLIVIYCEITDSLSKGKTFLSEFKRNLLLIKGLLFRVNCFKCKKQLERVSIKKISDNKFICNSCFEAIEAEKKKIIDELIKKYLSNKDGGFCYNIKILFETISTIGLEPYSLDKARERIRNRLTNLKIKKTTENIDEIIGLKNTFESWIIFLDDLEKLEKLLKNKGIELDYLTILAMFVEFMNSEYVGETDRLAEKLCKTVTESFEKVVNIEKVIKFLVECGWEIDSDFKFDVIRNLLEKLELKYAEGELRQLITEIKEEIDLKEFEQNLSSQQKSGLGEFKDLDGHGFEGYIQKIFEFLGYTVIRTPLTGDQGADLIISKEGTKTVIQAKRYEGNVSNKAIQEVVAAKNYYKAEKATVVTNSSFTKGALELALANNVELWDGEKLENIIKNLKTRKKQDYEQIIACKLGEDKKTINVACSLCKERFDYELALKELGGAQINEAFSFKTICPHCGVTLRAEIQKTKATWRCQYCSQEFDTEEKAEGHEKECKPRDISNPDV